MRAFGLEFPTEARRPQQPRFKARCAECGYVSPSVPMQALAALHLTGHCLSVEHRRRFMLLAPSEGRTPCRPDILRRDMADPVGEWAPLEVPRD